METIGAYEAKTNLAKLLERVIKGETFTITKHGYLLQYYRRPSPSVKKDLQK